MKNRKSSDEERTLELLRKAKQIAREYRELTGKPLGVTGEVAEYEAARILDLELAPPRQSGYDATERVGRSRRKLQIKGRCVLKDSKPGQKLGTIKIKREWDAVLLVLLDENFDAFEIYEADRKPVVAALTAPGSKARNVRGALSVSKFKSIGKIRWRRENVGTARGVLTGRTGCLCCEHRLPKGGRRVCPLCGHQFRGNGWDGIDAHWRARHENNLQYEAFWESLCRPHRG